MADRYDENLLLGYIEDDLDPQQQARFEQLLKEDARLRNLIAQLRQDRQMLRQLPKAEAPPHLLDQVMLPLERQMLLDAPGEITGPAPAAPPRRFNIVKLMSYGSLAAIVVVGLSLVVVTMISPHLPSDSDDSLLALNTELPPEAGPGAAGGKAGGRVVAESKSVDQAIRRSDSLAGSKRGFDEAADRLSDERASVAELAKIERSEAAQRAGPEPVELKPFETAYPTPRDGAGDAIRRTVGSAKAMASKPPAPLAPMPRSVESSPIARDEPRANEPPLVQDRRLVANTNTAIKDAGLAQRVVTRGVEQPTASFADGYETQPAQPQTVDLQLDVTTDDLLACQASLREYAQRLASGGSVWPPEPDTSKTASEPAPSEGSETKLLDRVATLLRQAGVVAPRQAQRREVVLQMPAEQLPDLLDQLNAPKHQSAQLTSRTPGWTYDRYRALRRPEPTTTTTTATVVAPARRQLMGSYKGRVEHGLDPNWAALIEQQLPLSPDAPVFEPGTALNLRVVVYQPPRVIEMEPSRPADAEMREGGLGEP